MVTSARGRMPRSARPWPTCCCSAEGRSHRWSCVSSTGLKRAARVSHRLPKASANSAAPASASRGAACSAIARKKSGAGWPAVAKAHAVSDSACGVNWPSLGAASAASASSSTGALCPAVAKAHARLASACSLKDCSRGAASAASASKSDGAG
eukprot:scaffold28259_cov107-Isochrysis_galbana.AAC.3